MRNISLIMNAGMEVSSYPPKFSSPTHPPMFMYRYFLGPLVAEVRGQEKLFVLLKLNVQRK